MKNIDILNRQCTETDLLLSQYGFVEEYETIVKKGKKEELRFLYLQLQPTIGLLVYNYYHTKTKGDLQGFDMFMYYSANLKDAISQFHRHNNSRNLPTFRLMSFQSKLKCVRLIIEKMLKEENGNFYTIESKYSKLSMELYYNGSTDFTDIYE